MCSDWPAAINSSFMLLLSNTVVNIEHTLTDHSRFGYCISVISASNTFQTDYIGIVCLV